MPTVIAHHDVNDTEHWLSSPKREQVLGPLGATNIRTFVSQQNPQQVAVLMDVADLDTMNAALANPSAELVEAMEYDTVRPETMSILVES